MNLRQILLVLALACGLVAAAEPTDSAAVSRGGGLQAADIGRDASRVTAHEWTFGVGWSNVLDTYLSPLEYTGTSFLVAHRTERKLGRRSPDRRCSASYVTFQSYIEARGAYASSPTDDNDYWDADFTGAIVWLRNWQLSDRWRVAVGGMAELTGGFTYTTNGGNNPAQARLAADIGASGVAEYKFRLWKQPFSVRSQMELPLLGLMFSPHYGQSYYEIFSLGHEDHNVCFTHPFNAPSVRWTTTLRWQWCSTTLSLGYMANVRQSHVNDLKHHTWNNLIVIGYSRRLRLLP